MSKASYKFNKYRIFDVTYYVFGKKGRAVSFKDTASDAVEDVRRRIYWSYHESFEITKVECKEIGK